MKRALLAFLLAALPSMAQQVLPKTEMLARTTVLAPGAGVSIDSNTYYASAHGTALSNCANAVATNCQISTSFVIPHTGDAVTVSVTLCWDGSCATNFGSGALTLSDGTNSYSLDVPASTSLLAQNVYNFEACNATAGTYTLTLNASGGEHFYYVNVEAVTWLGAPASSCVDTNVSNKANGTSANPSITSNGNVSQSGEGILVLMVTGNSPTNSGSCTTLESGALLNNVVVLDKFNPTSGATITCAVSQTSATWVGSIIGIK
jgi:hypothetical protein